MSTYISLRLRRLQKYFMFCDKKVVVHGVIQLGFRCVFNMFVMFINLIDEGLNVIVI